MKVIGIKGNYKNDSQEKPSVYLMADSSLLKDGKPLFLPEFAEEFIARPALVVRINRLGKNIAKRFASRYYDAVTVGLCVEARGVKKEAKLHDEASLCNAFDGSAVLGDFAPVDLIEKPENRVFSVTVNGGDSFTSSIDELVMDIDELIEELSKYFTFKIGDILYTGYKESEGISLNINDVICGRIGTEELLHFKVK